MGPFVQGVQVHRQSFVLVVELGLGLVEHVGLQVSVGAEIVPVRLGLEEA